MRGAFFVWWVFGGILLVHRALAVEYFPKPIDFQFAIRSERIGRQTRIETRVPVYRVETSYTLKKGMCERLKCVDSPSSGLKAWASVLAAPLDSKASELAGLVRGLGEETAQALVDRGILDTPPVTWPEFSKWIHAAQEEFEREGRPHRFESAVLGAHASENASRLGFGPCTVLLKSACEFEDPLETREFAFWDDRTIVFEVAANVAQGNLQLKIGSAWEGASVSTDGKMNYSVRFRTLLNREVWVQIDKKGEP